VAKLGTKSRSHFLSNQTSNIRTAFSPSLKQSLNPPYKVCSGEKVSLVLEDYYALLLQKVFIRLHKYVLIGKHVSIALHL